jgi:hypothetical protein
VRDGGIKRERERERERERKGERERGEFNIKGNSAFSVS